jgi:hypothetical protein
VLKGNSILTELDISNNHDEYNSQDGPGFAQELAVGIKDNGVLTSLNISNNDIGKLSPDAAKLDAAGWKYKKAKSGNVAYFKDGKGQRETPTECLSPLGAIALADAIPDTGALTSLQVGSNGIPEKEMREIMAIAMRMDNMKILCEVPFKDKTLTVLDVGGKDLGMEGALVVAEYLDGNEAMTSLNLAYTKLGVEGAKIIAACLPKCT